MSPGGSTFARKFAEQSSALYASFFGATTPKLGVFIVNKVKTTPYRLQNVAQPANTEGK
jgi:hypothetical protein